VFFFQAVPFNFYSIFAVLFTLMFALGVGPASWFRKLNAARERARTTGLLDRPGSEPMSARELTEIKTPEDYQPSLIDFFGPMGILLGVAIIPFVYTFWILGLDQPSLPIAEAFVLAVLAGFAIALARGMRLQVAIDGFIDGCKGVTIGAIVLALAVTLKAVADAVGTAPYVVETVGSWVPPVALPAMLLVLGMFVAFSTGTSWGTYAVLFPVAMPLAWAVMPDPFFLTLSFAAVTGGAVFGDQCSPISDTTILSSMFTGCDLMDHVRSQLPLALAVALLGGLLSTLSAALL
jgi:Na+/H+ antiporter NhaC